MKLGMVDTRMGPSHRRDSPAEDALVAPRRVAHPADGKAAVDRPHEQVAASPQVEGGWACLSGRPTAV